MLFEKQEHQENCIKQIMSSLTATTINQRTFMEVNHENLQQVQSDNSIMIRNRIERPWLDILMETGTGKTFSYIEAMHEMKDKHGINKFIIFVPRIAIRSGVIQNVKLTSNYFFQKYNRRIRYFTYKGANDLYQVLDFIRDHGEFSVLILTSHSITASNSNNRILARPQESLFGSESPLDSLQKMRPVIIIDEPHLLKGKGFVDSYNKYFSESLRLRFGATFSDDSDGTISNVVYTLSSIDAFRKYLVKRIAVTTIEDGESTIKFSKAPKKEGYPLNVHYFKGGIEYRKLLKFKENVSGVTEIAAHDFEVLKIKGNQVLLKNSKGEKTTRELSTTDYALSYSTIRLMIRRAIELHFDKEQFLFKRGIKTLTLFFIPGINDYRGDNPRIKDIFEDEYIKARKKKMKDSLDEGYRKYLKQDFDDNGELCVHEGYFAGDKGNSQDEKIAAGVDKILNRKKLMLSLDEPLRFVFSVWALQEGWDNPNIFTLCKLAPAEKETKRRQQVGRGLRLAVDQNGCRRTIEYCGDENSFYNINTLDVIVSGHEQGFIEGIQNEIIGENLTPHDITDKAIQNIVGSKEITTIIIGFLLGEEVITPSETEDNLYKANTPIADFLESNKKKISEKARESVDVLIDALRKAGTAQVINRNKKSTKVKIRDNFEHFDKLWRVITKKANIVYKDLDEGILISEIKKMFDREGVTSEQTIVSRHVYNHNDNSVIQADIIPMDNIEYSDFEINDFISSLSTDVGLPLRFCVSLVNEIGVSKISVNPRKALENLRWIIKRAIHNSVIQSVGYRFNGEIAISARNVFYEDEECKIRKSSIDSYIIGKHLDDKDKPPPNYLYDKIVYDSNIEKDVIRDDPLSISGIGEIAVFAKIPKISIPTPYKSYSPDFAYYIKKEDGGTLMLIAETKGYDSESDIPDKELRKIDYAKRFFDDLSAQTGLEVVYHKRINKQTLIDILLKVKGTQK